MTSSSIFSSWSARARVGLVALAVTLAAGACASKKDAPGDKTTGATKGAAAAKASAGPGGACDRREREHLCSEYHGRMAKPAWVKGECDAMKAPMLPACPADAAVGRCTRDAGTPQHTVTVFYPPMTGEASKAMCQGGEWSAG